MLNDIRYGFRTLAQNPGFASTAIVSIALAIGANAAIFSINDALLLRPLPVADPSQVVTVRPVEPMARSSVVNFSGGMSYADFIDFRDKTASFEGLLAYELIATGVAKDATSETQLRAGFLVSGNFFQLLGVGPALGRGFRPEEDQVPGRDRVIVLAHELWEQEFGGDPAIISRNIRLNGWDFTVIGVAPESFTGMDQFVRPAFFIPIMTGPLLGGHEDLLTNRGSRGFEVRGRLKRGISLQSADEEVSALAHSLQQAYPVTNRGFGAVVRTEMQARTDMRPNLVALVSSSFALVGLVLLIACANVANLMLGRGRARSREIAVRLAIGASRRRLIRQLMVESLLIALAGGALGLLLAEYAVELYSTVQILSDVSVRLGVQLDHRVLTFTILVSVASTVLFGLAPALHATKMDLAPTLKAGELDRARQRFFGQRALVILQVAGSFVVMLAAAQLYRGNLALLNAHPGFRRDHLITMRFDPSLAGYDSSRTQQFYKQLIERSAEVYGLESATLSSDLPLTSFCCRREAVIPEGYPFLPGQKAVTVLAGTVDDHFFGTLGVSIVAGRGFLPTDLPASPRVAVVNEAFARKYLGEQPVGKRVRFDDDQHEFWIEIVGVAVTGKYISISEPPTDMLYLPFSQNPRARMSLIAESAGEPAALAAPLKRLVGSLDPNLPIFAVHTMDNVFYQSAVKNLQLSSGAFGSAALIAFFLAVVGLYAVVAYQVARRTREIGIRMALGAERLQVMGMVLSQAGTMGFVGVCIGFALSLLLGPALSSGRQPPADPMLFTLVALVLLLTNVVAAAIPARRAARVDPQQVLRQD